MPAVEVSDVTTLARVPAPGTDATERVVRSVTDATSGFEGEGFPVRRAFAGVELADLDPFVHLDQMGPVEYAPGEAKGTAWHPHRGFESVTYIIDGSFEHQDNTGGGGTITSGGTQWLTTGAGVLHVERPSEALVTAGGPFHGLQLWVNLPRSRKFSEPRYQDLPGDDSVVLASDDGGALVRLIAGTIGDTDGPADTNSPVAVLHAILRADAELRLPWRADFNALVYVLTGDGTIGSGASARPLSSGQLAVLGTGDVIALTAGGEQGLDVMVLGGVPIREPVIWGGPFVMNSREEVHKAFDEYESGGFGPIPGSGAAPATAPGAGRPWASLAAATSRITRTPWTERKALLKRVLADRPAGR
jgi:redox-sensitive bicupin YhaK (pirin superfamily)